MGFTPLSIQGVAMETISGGGFQCLSEQHGCTNQLIDEMD